MTTNTNQETAERTIRVKAPSLDAAWHLAREMEYGRRDDTGDEFANFYGLAKGLVGVSKRDVARQANDERARAMFVASAERFAKGDVGGPDDPKGLNKRIDELRSS